VVDRYDAVLAREALDPPVLGLGDRNDTAALATPSVAAHCR
jgi:hypothetical protein